MSARPIAHHPLLSWFRRIPAVVIGSGVIVLIIIVLVVGVLIGITGGGEIVVEGVTPSTAYTGQDVNLAGKHLKQVDAVQLTRETELPQIMFMLPVDESRILITIPKDVPPNLYTITLRTKAGDTISTDQTLEVVASTTPVATPTPVPTVTSPETPGPEPAAAPEITIREVTVPSDQLWTDTGIRVSPDDEVHIEASGSIVYDTSGDHSGPDGTTKPTPGNECIFLLTDPDVKMHALVGNVAESPTLDGRGFLVGSNFRSSIPIENATSPAGTLFLGFNYGFVRCNGTDRTGPNSSAVNDNSGSFTARITVAPRSIAEPPPTATPIPSSTPPPAKFPRWEAEAASADPASLPPSGGTLTVRISTQEGSGTTITPISFRVSGPGDFRQNRTATDCAVSPHPETNPPYTSRCWLAEFDLPPNTTSGSQVYEITASSAQIEGERVGSVLVACESDSGLLSNGNFCAGLQGWSISRGTPGTRTVEVVESDPPHDNVVEVKSVGAGDRGSNSSASQDLNLRVSSAPSVVIEADVKAISASVANGCGFLGEEHPVGIFVKYLNSASEIHQIQFGFYYGRGSCGNAEPQGPEDPLIATRVNQGEWYHFESPDLKTLVPDLTTLTQVIVEGNGWDYVGRADNLKLTASSIAQLTDSPASDSQPSFSPDGSQVVFVSDRDGDPEIFIMNADGSDQTQLTFNNVRDAYPSFSPDGARILFERSLPSGTQCFPCPIISMNPDGSDEVVLRETLGAGATPRYSTDGGTVLFSDFDWGASANKLFRMAADGSGVEQLTFLTSGGESRFDGRPVLTPDGSRVVFVSNRDSDVDTEIFIMNTDGSNITQLTLNTASDHEPEVSPDGGVIAFSSDREAGDWDIYRMKLDGSSPEVLVATAGNDNHPRYSPDGTRLVFSSTLAGVSNIFLADIGGPGGNAVVPGTPSWTVGSDTWITVSSSFAGDKNGNSYTTYEYRASSRGPWTPACANGIPGESAWRHCTILDLAPDTEYSVRVNFHDPDGVGGENPQVTGPIRTSPDSSDSVTADFEAPDVIDIKDTYLLVKLEISGDSNGNSTLGSVAVSTGPTGPWAQKCGPSGNFNPKLCRIHSLSQGTDYWIRASVVDPDGVRGPEQRIYGPLKYAGLTNLALNKPVSTDIGWGCCPDSSQLVDGIVQYPDWPYGFAWAGGTDCYGSCPPGVKQATIDLERPQTIGRVDFWPHSGRIPTLWEVAVSSDGIDFTPVFSSSGPLCRTATGGLNTGWSILNCKHSAEFEPVVARYVRYSFDDRTIFEGQHGWSQEIEVFSP